MKLPIEAAQRSLGRVLTPPAIGPLQIIWQVIWIGFSLISPALYMILLRLAFGHVFPLNEEVRVVEYLTLADSHLQ